MSRVVYVVDESAKICTTSPGAAKLLVETDTSNGGPKVAAALLSLGQDLTKGEAAVVASTAALVLRPGRSSTGQQQDQLYDPLELVATSNIPMLPIDIGTKVGRISETAKVTADNDTNLNQKKRKRSKSKGTTHDDGDPPDFLQWLSSEENIGNWDVLCGRGGELINGAEFLSLFFVARSSQLVCSFVFYALQNTCLCNYCLVSKRNYANS